MLLLLLLLSCFSRVRLFATPQTEGLHKRVETIGYKLIIDDEAKKFIAQKGYDVQYGARPLKRAVQTYVEDLLSELLVDGTIPVGSTIYIDKHPEKDELRVI